MIKIFTRLPALPAPQGRSGPRCVEGHSSGNLEVVDHRSAARSVLLTLLAVVSAVVVGAAASSLLDINLSLAIVIVAFVASVAVAAIRLSRSHS
jgi:hypothetical protein